MYNEGENGEGKARKACCPETGYNCNVHRKYFFHAVYRVACNSHDLMMLFDLFAVARTCVFVIVIFDFALYIFIEKRTRASVFSGDLLTRAMRLQPPANQLG